MSPENFFAFLAVQVKLLHGDGSGTGSPGFVVIYCGSHEGCEIGEHCRLGALFFDVFI